MSFLSEKPEKADKDIGYMLFECSLLFLTVLLNQYKAHSITVNDFRKHTINKINYIKDNFDIINDSKKRLTVENLINECNEITNAL